MTNPLLDIEFIKKLMDNNEREIYVSATALDKEERPIETIEGKLQEGGSINVDGKSLIRRTCNFTIVADSININEFYWGLKNKFKLKIGIKNTVDETYPDIVWFKMGTYIITQFNTSLTAKGWTIKIQGKDKMCLLNGEVSGSLVAETDFSTEEYHDLENDTVTYREIPIKEIIKNIVQVFGGELPQNIIINDLDDSGLILMEYLNDDPAYLYKVQNTNEYKNIIIDGSVECYYEFPKTLTRDQFLSIPEEYSFLVSVYDLSSDGLFYEYNDKMPQELYDKIYRESYWSEDWWFLGKISDDFIITYDNLQSGLDFNPKATVIKFPVIEYDDKNQITSKTPSSINYALAKIETGEVPGYFSTDLTYANGEKKLIGNAGEALTSVLNKIKDMLVNFEYFYNIDGQFVFQKKKDYITTAWNSLDTNDMELYSNTNLDNDNIMFNFIDGKLVSSFSNNPKLTNIKNDYVVWGSYKNGQVEIPIHMRYAIDVKPKEYLPIRPLMEEVKTIYTKDGIVISENTKKNYFNEPFPHKIGSIADFQGSEAQEKEFDYCAQKIGIDKIALKTYYADYKAGYTANWDKIKDQIREESFFKFWHQTATFETNGQYSAALRRLLKGEEYNNFKVEEYSVLTEEGYTKTVITTPYFAARPIYSTKQEKIYGYNSHIPNPAYVEGSEKPGERDEFLSIIDYKVKFNQQSVHLDFDSFLKFELPLEQYNQFVIIETINPVDWRELIFQMALDYRRCNMFDNFYYYIRVANPQYPDGITGYEQYYIDLEGFWRDIYNPNPKLDFQSITFDEVKRLSLLVDDNAANDPYDTIYVQNGYKKISKENILEIELTPSNLCNIEQETNSKVAGPYPFITGKDCHLELGTPYFVEKDNKLKGYKANRVNDSQYTELNKVPLVNIYSKATKEFYVKGENNTYHPLAVFNKEIDLDKEYKQYLVSKYPTTHSLDKYKSNYHKFVDLKFNNLIEDENWYTKREYYYREKNYLKIKEMFDSNKVFKDIYYGSSINLIKSFAETLLEKNKALDYSKYPKDTKIKFLLDYINNIQEFLNSIKKYHYIDFNNGVEREIENSFNVSLSMITSIVSTFQQGYKSYLLPDYSCMGELLDNFLASVSKISQGTLVSSNIKRLYEQLNFIVRDISSKYQEVKSVEDIASEIRKGEINLTNIDIILEKHLNNLNKIITTAYEKGQLNITIKNIKEIRRMIADNRQLDPYVILDLINEHIAMPIKLMNIFVDDFIKDKGHIQTIQASSFKDFNSFITTFINISDDIERLLKDYDQNSENIEWLIEQLCFTRENGLLVPILSELYDLLVKSATKNQIEKYHQNISGFQEFILLTKLDNFGIPENSFTREKINYFVGNHNYNIEDKDGNFWNKKVYDNPQMLTFWFDFLDASQNELAKISVPAIGLRTKVVNEKNNIKAISYTEVPQVIFKRVGDNYDVKSGYTYININNNTEGFFRASSRTKSAKDRVEELLYQHTYCQEQINMSVIPVYSLEPNYHIYVRDNETNIDGEYIVEKITIPLSFKKTMSITATKAPPYLK